MASAAATTGDTHSSKIPDLLAGRDVRQVLAVGFGSSTYPLVGEDLIRAAVLNALDLGYRHLDSATLYGSKQAVAEAARCGVVASREEAFHPFVVEDVRVVMLSVLDLGYRHIDTMTLYGSEWIVGEAMAEAVQCGIAVSREELFVTSKVWCTQCHPELVILSLRDNLQ